MRLQSYFKKMKFSFRLMVAFLLITLAFICLGVYNNWQNEKIQAGYENLVTRSAPLVFEVKDINFELKNQEYCVREYILTGDSRYLSEYQASQARMTKLFDSLKKKLITPEGRQKTAEAEQTVAAYHEVTDKTIRLYQEQGAQEALKLIASARTTNEKAERTMNDFVTFLSDRMDLRIKQSREVSSSIEMQVKFVSIIIALAALSAGMWFARYISRPIKEIAALY